MDKYILACGFGFGHKPEYANDTDSLKTVVQFKSGQKWPENSPFATFIEVESKSLVHSVVLVLGNKSLVHFVVLVLGNT